VEKVSESPCKKRVMAMTFQPRDVSLRG